MSWYNSLPQYVTNWTAETKPNTSPSTEEKKKQSSTDQKQTKKNRSSIVKNKGKLKRKLDKQPTQASKKQKLTEKNFF